MTGKEYQALAMRTSVYLAGMNSSRLYHAVFGLNAEAGEVAGILQKEYQGHRMDMEHFKKELGDCLWMIAEACDVIGTDLDEIMQLNISKLKGRYPDGFTVKNSLHRKKGDV